MMAWLSSVLASSLGPDWIVGSDYGAVKFPALAQHFLRAWTAPSNNPIISPKLRQSKQGLSLLTRERPVVIRPSPPDHGAAGQPGAAG